MGMITTFDESLLLWIQNNLRNDFLTPIFEIITKLGDFGFIWIAMTIVLVCLGKTRRRGMVMTVSLAVTFLINNLLIKNLVHRIRPYEVMSDLNLIIEKESDFSFPSGHSAIAFGTAVVVFMLFSKRYSVYPLILAFLMAFSRLYVGVHYPTDVLGGIAIGTLVAFVTVKIAKRRESEKRTGYE